MQNFLKQHVGEHVTVSGRGSVRPFSGMLEAVGDDIAVIRTDSGVKAMRMDAIESVDIPERAEGNRMAAERKNMSGEQMEQRMQQAPHSMQQAPQQTPQRMQQPMERASDLVVPQYNTMPRSATVIG